MLLDRDYNIKFIDFGDAKKENEPPFDDEEEEEEAGNDDFSQELMEEFKDEGSSQRRGTFVGTVNYLAPEMAKDSESTCATDLWALGCIIFKMITGKAAFPGINTY